MSGVASTPMSLFEWQASMTERAAEAVAHWVTTTEEDKLQWEPKPTEESKARSIFDQVHECVRVNRGFAARLQHKEPAPVSESHSYRSGQEAADDLLSSATELVAVIRTLSFEDLERDFPMSRGTFKGRVLISLPANNMMYHGGAINYIQLLYGDDEFRIPPGIE